MSDDQNPPSEARPPLVQPVSPPSAPVREQSSFFGKLGKAWLYFSSALGTCGCLVSIFLIAGVVWSVSAVNRAIDQVDWSARAHYAEEYTVEYDAAGDDEIAIIPISGVIEDIASSDNPFETASGAVADRIISQLDDALTRSDVKAVILEIDSPGGTVYASERIYDKIAELAEDKPVVAQMKSVAASGGYMVALPADKIVAHPETLTGSIGVIMSVLNLDGLGEKIGVDEVIIKSGENKDMLAQFKPVDEEEVAILQAMVNESFERFRTRVLAYRELAEDWNERALDGRLLSATQALEAGLIDELGGQDEAVTAALELAGLNDADLIRYQAADFWSSFLSGALSKVGFSVDLAKELALPSSQPLYLWEGGLR